VLYRFNREDLLESLLDSPQLWALQVEVDVYTLLKKVRSKFTDVLFSIKMPQSYFQYGVIAVYKERECTGLLKVVYG
jgi:hypothetical protein